MRLHAIQHVAYEGPGMIAEWTCERRHTVAVTVTVTKHFSGGRLLALDHARRLLLKTVGAAIPRTTMLLEHRMKAGMLGYPRTAASAHCMNWTASGANSLNAPSTWTLGSSVNAPFLLEIE